MIQYRFTDDVRYFTCYMSYVQYLTFRQSPIIKECKVLKRNQAGYLKYIKEMQNSIEMLGKNDKNSLGKLSWPKYFIDKNGMVVLKQN